MTEATDTAAAAASTDPGVGLRAVAALRRLADQLEALQVRNARAAGWSWEDIGVALGVSKQAVHKKYGRVLAGVRVAAGGTAEGSAPIPPGRRAGHSTTGHTTTGHTTTGHTTTGER